MSTQERLKERQVALENSGVTDVKFCFGNLSQKPVSELASEAADALEAVSKGRAKKAKPIGDSMRK
jgi:hypothetical protein